MKKKAYNSMNKVELISELLHISVSSYYRYKNRDRPELISLLQNCFSVEDLRNWLEKSYIEAYDKNMLLNWFGYKICKLDVDNDDLLERIEVHDFECIIKTYILEFIRTSTDAETYSFYSYIKFCLDSSLDFNEQNIKDKEVIINHKKIALSVAGIFDKFDFIFLVNHYKRVVA